MSGYQRGAMAHEDTRDCTCDDVAGCSACFAAADALIGRQVRDEQGRIWRVTSAQARNEHISVSGERCWSMLDDVSLVHGSAMADLLEYAVLGGWDFNGQATWAEGRVFGFTSVRRIRRDGMRVLSERVVVHDEQAPSLEGSCAGLLRKLAEIEADELAARERAAVGAAVAVRDGD